MSDANDCVDHGYGVMIYFRPPLSKCPMCEIQDSLAHMTQAMILMTEVAQMLQKQLIAASDDASRLRAAIENQLFGFDEQDILETPELLELRKAYENKGEKCQT